MSVCRSWCMPWKVWLRPSPQPRTPAVSCLSLSAVLLLLRRNGVALDGPCLLRYSASHKWHSHRPNKPAADFVRNHWFNILLKWYRRYLEEKYAILMNYLCESRQWVRHPLLCGRLRVTGEYPCMDLRTNRLPAHLCVSALLGRIIFTAASPDDQQMEADFSDIPDLKHIGETHLFI